MTVYFSKEYTTGANIAASGTSAELYISEADQYAYGPFDQLTVQNNDSVTLRINLDYNTDRVLTIPPGYFSFRELSYKNFSISNVSAAVAHTAGKVRILVEQTHRPRRN